MQRRSRKSPKGGSDTRCASASGSRQDRGPGSSDGRRGTPNFRCPSPVSRNEVPGQASTRAIPGGVGSDSSRAGYDRVVERRRAVALARHYREVEGLSVAQIARRLGRSQATVKAYLYDPSNANKRPTDTPRGQRKTRRSAAQPHGRSLPALELTTARYTRAYQSQHQERKFFPRRIVFALGLAVQHVR